MQKVDEIKPVLNPTQNHFLSTLESVTPGPGIAMHKL